ncbi:1-propanol dehydrogenase PduQ [Alkalibacterium indicireducens]|uniref:1-propanol dehydrogenase PduQ n=1 Tax=Alkalibacterium indicireducens TaxID=398758 RepID=A0ABN1AGN9_9LACT
MNVWSLSTKVFTGIDSLERLKSLKKKSIFIVCDPFLIGSLIFKEIITLLIEKDNQLQVYSKVTPDPPITEVVQCMDEMQGFRPEVVLAIGGGSAIDLTKGVIFFSEKISSVPIEKFVVIPTTSGTGSEVTSVSVITDNKNDIKYPLVDNSMLPDEAILNPKLVLSSPPKVTAYSGMDVLTHALEALVAKNADTYTDALAEKAIEIIFEELVRCYENGDDLESRLLMHEASCLAGMSFNLAGLGISHALAHQVGGKLHVPHGLANTMLLPHVVKLNARNENAKKKYVRIMKRLKPDKNIGSEDMLIENLSHSIKSLAIQLDCPLSLTDFGIEKSLSRKYLDEVIRNAKKDFTFKTNPVEPSDQELGGIYTSIH